MLKGGLGLVIELLAYSNVCKSSYYDCL